MDNAIDPATEAQYEPAEAAAADPAQPGFGAPRFAADFTPSDASYWSVTDATAEGAAVWTGRGTHAGTAASALAKFLNAAVGPDPGKAPDTWKMRRALRPFASLDIDLL